MARAKASGAKEQEPPREDLAQKGEDIALKEAQARVEIEKELEGFMEHADPEPKIPADLAKMGVHSPTQSASQVLTQGPTIVLPFTQTQINHWLKRNVWDSCRWLAEWARRIIKAAASHGVRIIFGKEKV